MKSTLYPLQFEPIFKPKIWGGDKIRTVLGKDFGSATNCGESWEISGVKGDFTHVKAGPFAGKSLHELFEEYGPALVGNRVHRDSPHEFPLLIKFLDAREDLSIQVHPNDEQALRMHGCKGKTEMWYVLDADEGASLIAGFKRDTNREEYLKALAEGELMSLLNREEVEAGDVFFLPSGRIHTIGAGLLIAEIQQTSDITYRIYDFDRTDDQGNKRELHNDKAVEVLDFHNRAPYKTTYIDDVNKVVQLVQAQYFETNKITFDMKLERNFNALDSFVVYICTGGACTLEAGGNEVFLALGDTVLVPADAVAAIQLSPEPACQLLETYVPQ
jgi:mannose-6-phosphate isomerase